MNHSIEGRCFGRKYILSIIAFMALLHVAEGIDASDQVSSAKDLSYITEQFPPYNFRDDGNLKGISIDLLEAVWQRMGVNLNRSVIQVLPWTEGYKRTLNEKKPFSSPLRGCHKESSSLNGPAQLVPLGMCYWHESIRTSVSHLQKI